MTTRLEAQENLSVWYERAGQSFSLRPFPNSKQEAWRATNLKTLREVTLAGVVPFQLELAQVGPDGREVPLTEPPKGLTISMGENAFSGKSLNPDEFYEDIPKLFPQHSVRIDVSKTFAADSPLVFRWVIPSAEAQGLGLAPINVTWNVEPDAAIYFVKKVSSDLPVMTVWREEFQLGEGSKVETVTLAEAGEGLHLESRAVRLPENSSWTSLILDVGSRYSRFSLNCHLEGENADCRALGAVGLTGAQVSEHPTILDHVAPHSTSTQLYKSAMNGSSRAVINGRVVIRQDAQKVNSSQYNKNLLLSDAAYVHSKPELRVSADDVQAAHGATTGQLDPDELFYLQARGLSESRAKELISAGFLLEVVEPLSSAPLRAWAVPALQKSLPAILEDPS